MRDCNDLFILLFIILNVAIANAYRSSQETFLEGAAFEYQQIGFNM
jgi:hypothetical protein